MIEAAGDGFVFGAEAADNRVQAGLHVIGVFVLQVVVDEDDHGERKGLGGEDVDALLDVILEDAKFVATQVRHEFAGVAFDGDGQNDEIGIYGNAGLGVGERGGGRTRRL